MTVNKVVYDGKTLIDLSADSVTPETLAEGVTAHAASGAPIVGIAPTTAVRYTEQSLSDAQKKQARENIDAEPFVFEISYDPEAASAPYPDGVSYDDIVAAYTLGRTVICKVEMDGNYLQCPLMAYMEGMVLFGVFADSFMAVMAMPEGIAYQMIEIATGEDIPYELPNPNKLKLTGAVTAEYDGSSEITVNIPTSFVFEADGETGAYLNGVTYDDIRAAYDAGMTITCRMHTLGTIANTHFLGELEGAFVFTALFNHWEYLLMAVSSGVLIQQTKIAQADDIPDRLPNPEYLSFTGAVSGAYNGQQHMVVNIPESISDYNKLENKPLLPFPIDNNYTINLRDLQDGTLYYFPNTCYNAPKSLIKFVLEAPDGTLRTVIDGGGNSGAYDQIEVDQIYHVVFERVFDSSIGEYYLTLTIEGGNTRAFVRLCNSAGKEDVDISAEPFYFLSGNVYNQKYFSQDNRKSFTPTRDTHLVNKKYVDAADAKVTANIPTAIETALAQAKASGEFNGADGTSVTHSWNGTTLSITSASGTTSADLKGDKGDKGDTGSAGATGRRGTGLLKATTAPSSYTTAIGDYVPKYRIALSTLKTQSGVNEVFVGDIVEQSYYHYTIDYLDASYAYISATRVSFRGAAGTTPAKGTDYYTEADKTEMVGLVKAALPTLSIKGKDADGVEHTWTVYGS